MYSVYASPSRQGFFSTENHGEPMIPAVDQPDAGTVILVRNPLSTIPEDAVLVPGGREQVAQILATQVGGKVLDWSGGIPTAVDRPPLPLDQAQAHQLDVLADACQAQIVSGFRSSALGAEHAYPAKLTDQVNLSASVIDSIVPGLPSEWTTPFWCAGADGVWRYEAHTASQIQQVGRDAKAAILAALERKAALETQVQAATTVEQVEAVTWEEEPAS